MAQFHNREARTAQHQAVRVAEQTGPAHTPVEPNGVVNLQRLIGNQAVQRLMSSVGVQAKMTVGAADDAYEREADSVASQVMSSAQATVSRAGEEDELMTKRLPQVQRMGPGEEEELAMKRADVQRESVSEEEEPIQMQRADVQREEQNLSGSFDIEGQLESQIQNTNGSGQSLPQQATGMFSQHMGHDFSNVNIHSDSSADSLNRSLGARAFTSGSDIYFRSGEYNPGTTDGQQLLAHELTHVVQQTGGKPVQPKREDCADC